MELSSSQPAVVLDQQEFCPSGDTWQCLEMCFGCHTGVCGGCYWYLAGIW